MKKTMLILAFTSFVIVCVTGLPSFAESEYEKWQREELNSFSEFRDKRDKDFTSYLKKQWSEFKLFKGDKLYDKPKPVSLPVAKKKSPKKAVPLKGEVIKKVSLPPPPKKIKRKKELPAMAIVKKGKTLKLDFYGSSLSFSYDPKIKTSMGGEIDKNSISSFWEVLSKSEYESLVKQVQHYKKALKLNDWGYHRLTYNIGKQIYTKSQNGATMFTWFFLTKSGYEAKIGYNNNSVHLLMPSKQALFSVPYLTFKEKKFYAVSFDGKRKKLGSLYTYKGNYPDARKLMNYEIKSVPQIIKIVKNRNLKFNYRGKDYNIPVEYDKSVVEYFKYYPQTDIEVYFEASISKEANRSLIKGLKPLVEGKTEGEAVNIILRLVQTSFQYKTDDNQFGREKYMLPEETLFYPFSDCEDRSILFAYLVKKLVGLEVVGLHYPNHIATAVKFSSEIKGESITYNGKKYIISDPTYINADIGTSMPQFKKIKPKVIKII